MIWSRGSGGAGGIGRQQGQGLEEHDDESSLCVFVICARLAYLLCGYSTVYFLLLLCGVFPLSPPPPPVRACHYCQETRV